MDYGTMTPADFAAVMGNGNVNRGYGGGWGGFGDGQGWWVLLLFLFAMNGGWGNNGWGNNGNGLNNAAVPYMMSESTQAAVQNGFNQQSILNGINGINSTLANGFADAAVATCQGNANITAAITNGQYATAQAITGAKDTINGTLYANQLANNQTMNQIAMNLQQCLKKGIQAIKNIFKSEENFAIGTCAA